MTYKDPEKRRASNRKAVSRYKKRTDGKTAHKDGKRRARQLQALPPWLSIQQNWKIRHIYDEAVRLKRAKGIDYQVDHIWPLRGRTAWGLHVPWNLRVIPASENVKKSNSIPAEPGWSIQT